MKMVHTGEDGTVTEISLQVTDMETGHPKLIVTLPDTGNASDYAPGGKGHPKKAFVEEALLAAHARSAETAFQAIDNPNAPGNTLTFRPLVAAGIDDFYYIRADNPVVDKSRWPNFLRVAKDELERAGFRDADHVERRPSIQQPDERIHIQGIFTGVPDRYNPHRNRTSGTQR